MHSTFSDGVEEPEELVIRAKNNGVELISLTDHDETGGLFDIFFYSIDRG